METVTLKSAITFYILIGGRECAFTTRSFQGKRGGGGNIPEPKDHVPYTVSYILIESTNPWYKLEKPVTIAILWSNVLNIQYAGGE